MLKFFELIVNWYLNLLVDNVIKREIKREKVQMKPLIHISSMLQWISKRLSPKKSSLWTLSCLSAYLGIHFEPSCPTGRIIHGPCNVFFSEEFVPKEPCCLVIRNAIKSSFARWQNSFIVFPWSKAWLGFFTRSNCAAPRESRKEKFFSLHWYWRFTVKSRVEACRD